MVIDTEEKNNARDKGNKNIARKRQEYCQEDRIEECSLETEEKIITRKRKKKNVGQGDRKEEYCQSQKRKAQC